MKMNKNNIKIIVLTGGPCSGKSEGVKELKRILSDSDYKAITIPEACNRNETKWVHMFRRHCIKN